MRMEDTENKVKCEVFLCLHNTHLSACWWWITCWRLDLHKATAKQTGRATHCFLIRIFLTKKSGITVWIIDAFISSLGDGAGDQRQLSARRSALQKGRGRGLWHSQSLLCRLRDAEGRPEGSRNISADPRRRSTQKSLFSCDMLVIHLWSLGDGWSYLLPFHVWRSHVWFGWIHKVSVTEETGLCFRALLHSVCRIHKGVSFSHKTGGPKLSISHLPTPLCLSLCSFCSAWQCSSCATTKVVLENKCKEFTSPLTKEMHLPLVWVWCLGP